MSAAALKVTTEARPSSRLAVTVTVPGERCKTSYEDAITSLSRSINLPGFRKGKVPRTVLVQQLGGVRIKATALEKLIDNAWRDAIQQESLEPISQPDLSSGFDGLLESFEPGKELTFTLEADVAPTPKLKTTKGLKAEFETVAYDASRVDAMLEDSRKQMATVVPVEGRAAQNGDIAVLGFKGTYSDDGSEIEGGSADSMDVDLENGRMIPGFIEGVIGMKVGETKTVDCQFPDDYPKEDARGRKAAFAIELKDLKTRELPELDDAFAKQASEQETLADLRKDLEQRLKDDAERRQTSNRRDALVAALVEQLEVELPEALIQQESRNLLEQTAAQFAQQGMDVKSLFTPDLVRNLMQNSRPEAEERLRRSFALTALAEAEDIKLDDKDVDAKIREVKKELSADAKIAPERLRQAVMDDLMQDRLMGWLEENSTLTEKAPAADDSKAEAKKKPTAKKAPTKSKSKADAKD
ncbi:trigger factor [Synechococcus sp. RS9902]|uniref:trigger factor n=1 Tax=Synechococcus sp. RS9902 TaxID=221345 RepID=UPI001645815B|nr:trigger factor [Synechococcus sp. RS9902]QNI96004.1 trigger factor [Synechococcus sp. RS9902]